MKTRSQIILFFTVVFILFSIFWTAATAQEKQFSILAGYKSLEGGFTYTDEESELIYGIAASLMDSKTSEKIANFHDTSKHNFKGDVVPAAFGLIGAKFDKVKLIGKIGFAYLEQEINNIPDHQKFYFAFGLAYSYEFDNEISVIGSLDSVNAVMAGASFKF
ncbi:hypothetical protein [Flavobacterium anhuiense]|uniref:hypothetical protein n=1 Tax=Flavobacterium anhuiense TaxID=459526 RepID=UPI00202667B8|nr:hypothetical protein [Flavobacterium anhuiense]URM37167.1 hypothetical protein LLY39_00820 [Flavobacterium anhuiense]